MHNVRTTINIASLNENQRRLFYFEKNFPELLNDINNFNIKYKIENFTILLYHYHHKLDDCVKCLICGKNTNFLSFNKGYNKYCSRKCSMNDENIISKKSQSYINTNLKKYGVSNPAKLNSTKTKIKKTNLERYGVDNYAKTIEFREKVINTNMNKYGKEWYQQTENFKEKSISTSIYKWGSKHYMKNEDNIRIIKDNNIKKWGVDSFFKTDIFKKNMNSYYKSESFVEKVNRQRLNRKKLDINYYKNYNSDYYLLDIENNLLVFNCDKCGEFKISKQLFYLRSKNGNNCCTICNKTDIKNTSYKEKKLLEFISELYDGNIIENYRNKYEIDIYLPELKLGFEFNGLYWHSDLFKSKNYHRDKTLYFNKIGIDIFNIWEDDWDYKTEIIKSMIRYKIKKNIKKIHARKCQIKLVSNEISKKFLNDNHLQGYSISRYRFGLFYKDELVSLITFGVSRNRNKDIELIRFCNKINTTIIGGFSKLFNFYIKNYDFDKIITYADISNSNGYLYKKNKLNFEKVTDVGYYWCINGIKYNRFNFRKSKLIDEGYDINKTEDEIMKERGFYKIYNCGNYKFYFTK